MGAAPIVTSVPQAANVIDARGKLTPPWTTYHNNNTLVLQSLVRFGTTANRPTKEVWLGQVYFDTSVQRPVWCISTSPIIWGDFLGGLYAAIFTNLNITGSFTFTGSSIDAFVYTNAAGALASTPSATNGQLLIGSTGNVPVAGTLTPSSGINVVNGAGTITISNTGVLSNIAGTGISVSGATGNVTISNTGVLTFSAGTTGLTPNSATAGAIVLAGVLNVANGGTGLSTTPTNGQVLIGNGSGYTLNTLTQGTGITITNGSGTITIAGTGGTVTSVALADGSSSPIYTISGSPITTSGTLTFTLSTQTANKVFAGPTSGGAAQPTFRALVNADLPTPVYAGFKAADLTSGSATLTADADLTLTLPIGTYKVDCYLAFYEATLGTGGFQFDFNSGSATVGAINLGGDGYITASVFNPAITSVSTATQFATVATASGAPSWYNVQGYLNITVAGTIAIRWAQNTISVNVTTLMKGSQFTVTKIG